MELATSIKVSSSALIVCSLLLIPSLYAFDADVWAAKNDAMAREAARLKADFAVYAAKSSKPAEGLTIPFEVFDSGEVKAVVIARYGQFFHDVGYVWARDITVERYKEDGELDMRLEAEQCLVDRPHKCCWIAGRVKAYHRKTTLEGVDAFYCSSNNFLKVMSNAKVVSEDVKMKGLKL